jgi:hypothetical protein
MGVCAGAALYEIEMQARDFAKVSYVSSKTPEDVDACLTDGFAETDELNIDEIGGGRGVKFFDRFNRSYSIKPEGGSLIIKGDETADVQVSWKRSIPSSVETLIKRCTQ